MSPGARGNPARLFPVLVVVPIRLFLAAGWLRAGVEKLIDDNWWNGHALRSFLADHSSNGLPFFHPIVDRGIEPLALAVAFVVMATEIACGIAIALGRGLRLALRWGLLLNITFILCGQVNPSAFYVVMEMTLLFAIAEGVVGSQPTRPSWRTLALAGACLAGGLAMVPYIRTVEPALVISDSAMMLLFLAVITATTLVVRWALMSSRGMSPSPVGRWSERIATWAIARPDPRQPLVETRPATRPAGDGGWRSVSWAPPSMADRPVARRL
jgi:uncharacterized membrane protein YphA (DoxX/SURF4 family)